MRIPMETLAEYNDRLCKSWGPFEFGLLIRLDGLIIANAEKTKKTAPTPRSDGAASVPEPEAIRMDNSEGLKTLFRSIGTRKFGRESQSSD